MLGVATSEMRTNLTRKLHLEFWQNVLRIHPTGDTLLSDPHENGSSAAYHYSKRGKPLVSGRGGLLPCGILPEPSTIMFNIMPSVKGELITRSSSNITKQDKGGWFRG